MATLITAFIRETRLDSKHKAVLPAKDRQAALAKAIVPLLEQAHALGVAHANDGLQKRSVVQAVTGGFLAKAEQIVSTLVATITDTVAGWLDSLLGGSAEVDASDIADRVTEKLDAFATTQGENVALYEVPYAIEEAVLETWQEQGIPDIVAIASEGACEMCKANAAQGAIPIGTEFQSGHAFPPFHGCCRCLLGMA